MHATDLRASAPVFVDACKVKWTWVCGSLHACAAAGVRACLCLRVCGGVRDIVSHVPACAHLPNLCALLQELMCVLPDRLCVCVCVRGCVPCVGESLSVCGGQGYQDPHPLHSPGPLCCGAAALVAG